MYSDSYKAKERDKLYQAIDMVKNNGNNEQTGKTETGFNINSLAEQWDKLSQKRNFKRVLK